MTRSINLDSRVWISFASIDELAHLTPDPVESESLGPRAVAKRRKEFHAGRSLARIVLGQAGLAPASIPMKNNRLPSWPNDVIAAISHTSTHVAVAMSHSNQVSALGLDIELQGTVESDIFSQVLVPEEIEQLEQTTKTATDYFSAKEAAFKACFPQHNEYFEFTDVLIKFGASGFTCNPLNTLASNAYLVRGTGTVAAIESHVVSLFCVERE